jgi:hypothetical protein
MTDLSADQIVKKIIRTLRATSREFAKAATTKNSARNGKRGKPTLGKPAIRRR